MGGRALCSNRGVEFVFMYDVPQRGDALDLLKSLPADSSPLVFFDRQFRALLDRQKYGNEGKSRQQKRARLPSMSEHYIDAACRAIARVLRPSGYLMRWIDDYSLCEGHLVRVKDVLQCVGLCAWENTLMGQGCRLRDCGSHLAVPQKPVLVGMKLTFPAKKTWWDRGIRNRWCEYVPRGGHPHIKPIGLIKRLIEATTKPGDLVVDPCVGSFVVLQECQRLGRKFIGCDLAYEEHPAEPPAQPGEFSGCGVHVVSHERSIN
jgi:site-specific DNA-methyltransferase (adenine-specific)